MPKKQKDGRYRAKIMVAGQAVYVSGRTTKELEAEKRRVREELITGKQKNDTLFIDFIIDWWEHVRKPIIKAKGTEELYRGILNKWILPAVPKRKLCAAIRRDDIVSCINYAHDGGASEQVQRTILARLREICMYGMECGLIAADYTNSVQVRAQEKITPKKERRIYIPDEHIRKIFLLAKGRDIETHIYLAYFLGVRLGEAEALTWGDIDFDNRTVFIHRTNTPTEGVVERTKTSSGQRTIVMPSRLAAYLKPRRGFPNAPVCVKMSRPVTLMRWGRLMVDCGFGEEISHQKFNIPYTFHTLRHTYITKLYDAGVDPLTASRLAGHSSYSTTANVYTAISKEREEKTAATIEKAFES